VAPERLPAGQHAAPCTCRYSRLLRLDRRRSVAFRVATRRCLRFSCVARSANPTRSRFAPKPSGVDSVGGGQQLVDVGDGFWSCATMVASSDSAEGVDLIWSVSTNVDGRPHWAKVNYLDGAELATIHPRWDDWWRVRDAADPDDLFLNDYLASIRPERTFDSG
jgi:hypothetical protein